MPHDEIFDQDFIDAARHREPAYVEGRNVWPPPNVPPVSQSQIFLSPPPAAEPPSRRRLKAFSMFTAWCTVFAVVMVFFSPFQQQQTIIPPGLQGPPDAGYSFIRLRDDGSPLSYDPCSPIEVFVNPEAGPEDAEMLVMKVLGELRELTGFDLRFAGLTDEIPSVDRAAETVLVAWSDADEIEELADDVVGLGGSGGGADQSGRLFYTGGFVYVDTDLSPLSSPTSSVSDVAILRHELAHVLGLDHTSDPNQLMAEYNYGLSDFQEGDLLGLSQLSNSICAT